MADLRIREEARVAEASTAFQAKAMADDLAGYRAMADLRIREEARVAEARDAATSRRARAQVNQAMANPAGA
jgi:hypothetical protein